MRAVSKNLGQIVLLRESHIALRLGVGLRAPTWLTAKLFYILPSIMDPSHNRGFYYFYEI